MDKYILSKSTRKNKKWLITTPLNIKIHIGDIRYQDYTQHKDPQRKELYIKRHYKNEDWSISGIMTSGYWAKNLLWNKPTLKDSIKDIERRFNIKIIKR